MSCRAYRDHGTTTMVCNRCGYQWDMDDPDPPTCKTWDDIKQERRDREQAIRDRRKQIAEIEKKKIAEFLK